MSANDSPFSEPQAPLQLPPAQPPRDPVWSGWDVAIIAAMLFVSFFIFLWIIAVFTRVSLSQGQTPQLLRVMLSAQFLSYAVVLICMRVIVRCYQRRFADAVHWNWPREYRWIAYLLGGMALAVLVQFLSSLLPIPKTLPIDRYFQNRSSAYIMSIFGISMAPLVEELFFRGFLYPVLARRLGTAVGVVLTALGFAFVHSSQLASAWAPLLVLFVVGLVFTIVRVKTSNVAPGFLMHVGYNLMLFTLLFFATDHFQHMEKMLQQ